MSLFLDYLWIWIVLTFCVGICGYVWYVNNQSRRNLYIAFALPIFTFALGLTLYYGVDTNRKSITRTLNALIAAVERDDSEDVCKFISPKAEEVQKFTREKMRLISISRTKYHNLKISINDAASPPVADVRFSTVFYWKNKEPNDIISLDQPVPDSVRFEIEFVRTKNQSWLITNKFQFFPLRNYR